MKQVILGEMPDANGNIVLEGDDYHYLVRVRRLKAGSVIRAVIPNGEIDLEILSTAGGKILANPRSITSGQPACSQPQSVVPILLLQSLPKGSRMDMIVRQAAELGIAVIAPFFSQHSFQNSPGIEKIRRWERIIKEARQQSGSAMPTKIRPPCNIEGILKYWENLVKEEPETTGIFLHHQPLDEKGFHDYLYSNPKQVVILVGPEGGFSAEEAGLFIGAGLKPLMIGSTILRTETAALYGLAAVRTLILECASWKQK